MNIPLTYRLGASALFTVVLYSVMFAPYSLDLTDAGFITGLSWRIINGQLPYQDFIYIRPPVSLYLHAGIMKITPEAYQQLFFRVIFYIGMAITCLLTLKIVEKYIKIPYPEIAFFGMFAFSVHNFPAMPWHTTDGIILSVVGLYLLTKDKFFIAGLVLVCAALTKQSFYPVILIGLIYCIYYYGLKSSVRYLSGVFAMLAIFACFLIYLGIFDQFLLSIASQSKIDDLIYAGFSVYLKESIKPLIIIFVIYFLLRATKLKSHAFQYTLWIVLALVFFSYISSYLRKEVFQIPPYGITQSLFLFGAVYALYQTVKTHEKITPSPWFALLSLMGISWCVSISWGYTTPALYSAPLILCLLLSYKEKLQPFLFFCALSIGGFFTYSVAQLYPYGDSARHLLVHDAGKIYPKLSGIKTSQGTYEKLLELKELSMVESCFKVLPSIPHANYLSNTQSPIPIDWALNTEYKSSDNDLLHLLNLSGCTVFIEKDKIQYIENNQGRRFGSDISLEVMENWKNVGETNHFLLYQK